MPIQFIQCDYFPLGRLVATCGVQEAIPSANVLAVLKRHARCDWGELDDHDCGVNTDALEHGGRLFSKYTVKDVEGSNRDVYVITDGIEPGGHGAYSTTVLFPSEY